MHIHVPNLLVLHVTKTACICTSSYIEGNPFLFKQSLSPPSADDSLIWLPSIKPTTPGKLHNSSTFREISSAYLDLAIWSPIQFCLFVSTTIYIWDRGKSQQHDFLIRIQLHQSLQGLYYGQLTWINWTHVPVLSSTACLPCNTVLLRSNCVVLSMSLSQKIFKEFSKNNIEKVSTDSIMISEVVYFFRNLHVVYNFHVVNDGWDGFSFLSNRQSFIRTLFVRI